MRKLFRQRTNEHARQVARACRLLGHHGVTYGALGHVSYREPGSDRIYIKGKGVDQVGMRFTTPQDVIQVDFEARMVAGKEGLQPPSEAFIHLGLYEQNPSLSSVIHVHPQDVVLLTVCEKGILPILGAYGKSAKIAAAGVPTYPRSLIISDAQAGKEFAEFVGRNKVVMMRGHGATVVGDGVEDATVRAIAFDQLAAMMYKAYLLGDPQPISPEDLDAIRRPTPAVKDRGSAGGKAGTLAVWNYYCRLEAERLVDR